MQLEMEFLPTVEMDGRLFRIKSFRSTGIFEQFGAVEYWHDKYGWRECKNLEQTHKVAKELWCYKDSDSNE